YRSLDVALIDLRERKTIVGTEGRGPFYLPGQRRVEVLAGFGIVTLHHFVVAEKRVDPRSAAVELDRSLERRVCFVEFAEIGVNLADQHLNHPVIGVLPGEVEKQRKRFSRLLGSSEQHGFDVTALTV